MKGSLLPLAPVISFILLTSCTSQPKPVATETIEEQTILTNTYSPTTPPPTVTSSPSANLSPLPAHSTFATLIPETPAASSAEYHLASRTADDADEAILRMEQAIQNLENITMQGMPPYGAYYRATAYAIVDALIHFPDDPRVEIWQWKLAYYMALGGDGNEATQIYTQKIDQALNQQGLNPEDLPSWFKSGETHPTYFTQSFTLKLTPVSVPKINTGYLVEIGPLENIDTPGESCLLITGNRQTYSIFKLYNGFPKGGFFMGLRNPTSCYLRDVTGDGINEVIIDRYEGGHVGTTYIRIFDISSLPPKALPFYPEQEGEVQFWGGYLDYSDASTNITIEEPLGFCDDSAKRTFKWNGKWFDFTTGQVDFYGEPGPVENCFGRIVSFGEELKPQDAIKLFGLSFEAYQPIVEGLNRDFIEEFRVLKGLYSAYLGDVDSARAIFTQVANAPLLENSAWITPAKNFLQAYHSKADLYQAASTLTTCSPTYAQFLYPPTTCVDISLYDKELALQYIVANVYASDPIEKIPNDLKELGIRVRQYGRFDFDIDGQDELWLTLSHPRDDEIELWIAVNSQKGIKVSFVTDSLSPEPEFIQSKDKNGTITTSVNGNRQIKMPRNPLTGEPFVFATKIEGVDPAQQKLDKFLLLRQKIINGENPQHIYSELETIARSSSKCPFAITGSDGSESFYYDCAAFYYTAAITAELVGKSEDAVVLYHKIWSEYPYSPFAILVRLKLEK